MRRALLRILAPVPLAVACASSDAEPTPPTSAAPDDEPIADASDAAEPAAEAGSRTDAGESSCSEAGWCTTALPDVDLELMDIWPISDGTAAFAIAESPTLGVKVLAWDKTSNAWRYIDDSSQNVRGRGEYAGGIWAPSANEVYFTAAPGSIYHGTRPSDPAAKAWPWTRATLADNSPDAVDAPSAVPHDHGYPRNPSLEGNTPSLGVWGTSATNVYAWYANTIYHLSTGDDGGSEWIAEYTARDVDSDPDNAEVVEHIYLVSAAGTGPDDVWFSGTRDRYPFGTACAVLVHKTSDGYQRVADGVVPNAGGKQQSCQARRGVFMIGGRDGWLTDIQTRSAGGMIGLKGGRDVVRIVETGGVYAAETYSIPIEVTIFKSGLASLFSPADVGDDQVWLTGFGLVLRGADVWGGGDGLRISTISLNGSPTRQAIHRVRGSSSHDLWAVGARYAFHKTTP